MVLFFFALISSASNAFESQTFFGLGDIYQGLHITNRFWNGAKNDSKGYVSRLGYELRGGAEEAFVGNLQDTTSFLMVGLLFDTSPQLRFGIHFGGTYTRIERATLGSILMECTYLVLPDSQGVVEFLKQRHASDRPESSSGDSEDALMSFRASRRREIASERQKDEADLWHYVMLDRYPRWELKTILGFHEHFIDPKTMRSGAALSQALRLNQFEIGMTAMRVISKRKNYLLGLSFYSTSQSSVALQSAREIRSSMVLYPDTYIAPILQLFPIMRAHQAILWQYDYNWAFQLELQEFLASAVSVSAQSKLTTSLSGNWFIAGSLGAVAGGLSLVGGGVEFYRFF